MTETWKQVLIRLIKHSPEHDHEYDEVQNRAHNWHQCAVGEVMKIPQPDVYFGPYTEDSLFVATRTVDSALVTLAHKFTDAIDAGKYGKALKLEEMIRGSLVPHAREIWRAYVRIQQAERRYNINALHYPEPRGPFLDVRS